jgi:hypothetical protein
VADFSIADPCQKRRNEPTAASNQMLLERQINAAYGLSTDMRPRHQTPLRPWCWQHSRAARANGSAPQT